MTEFLKTRYPTKGGEIPAERGDLRVAGKSASKEKTTTGRGRGEERASGIAQLLTCRPSRRGADFNWEERRGAQEGKKKPRWEGPAERREEGALQTEKKKGSRVEDAADIPMLNLRRRSTSNLK